MSLAVPSPQEYRDALDRLAREHARRVVAESVLVGAQARPRRRVRALSPMAEHARMLLHRIPPEPLDVVLARHYALEVSP